MKTLKLLVASLASLIFLTGCGSDKIVFEGKIIGYNGEYTEFFLLNPEGEGFIEVPFEINEDGTFSAEIDFPKSEFDARLFVDKFMFCTCVEQGQRYYAEFDITEEGIETNFRFIGNGAAENEFTRDYWSTFGFDYLFIDTISNAKDFASYKELVKNAADSLIKRLEEIGNDGLTEYYSSLIREAENRYSHYYPYIYLTEYNEIPEDQAYQEFLASGWSEGYTDEDFSKLLNGISSVVSSMKLDLLKAIQIAEKTSEIETWNHFLMTSLLINRLQLSGPEGMSDAYKYYRSVVTDENFINQIAPKYESVAKFIKGAPALDIEMSDISGNVFRLSEFKGKALYIDFWASWCKPCCEEIPHLQKIVNELGCDRDIEVISISIDEDDRSWKKRLEEENPTWKQYIATSAGLKTISDEYQISSIPRFVLIDKNGNIITVNAPRPSDLNVDSMKELLK